MAAGMPDLVDCASLAADAVGLQRTYEFGDLVRVKELLADPAGTLRAGFAFGKTGLGRPGAAVTVEATAQLVCQRCMQNFALLVSGGSAVEFADSDEVGGADPEREYFLLPGPFSLF